MPVEIVRCNSPLIVALPYTGANMPRTLIERLARKNTLFTAPDRFLLRLLDEFAEDTNLIHANFRRFLSDADCPSSRAPRQQENGMIGPVPVLDRYGTSIWDHPPSMKEATNWRAMYYAPYHAALAAQLARMRATHGHAVLLNLRAGHPANPSVQDLNKQRVGFADGGGRTCGIDLSLRIINVLKSDMAFAPELNAATATGGTAQRHGRPNAHLHAIDIEVSEASYLTRSDADILYDARKAQPLRALLGDIIRTLCEWRPS